MKIHSFALIGALFGSASASSNTNQGLLSNGQVSLGDWQAAYENASHFVSKPNTTEKINLITGSSDYYYVSAFSQASGLAMTWDKDAIYAQAKAVATEFYLKGIQVVDGPTSQPLGRTPWGGRSVETFGSDLYLNGIATGLSAKAYKDTGVIGGAKETNRTGSMGGDVGAGGGAGGPPSMDSSSSSASPSSSSTAAQPSSSSAGGMDGGASMSSPSSSSSSGAPYSSNADTKTLHEMYLWSFYDGVHSGLGGVMCL
ncbi:hypothetical protein N7532_001682 [Penicillium argentinense]|uniref:beta-glucosidase n=1 Tax=Penicillium argentinense TaxID=1131581 RepID=A0A9W9G332_9EURO|nr:uncharacterized protein N7532_001682 [Penicillium argentinense]KAJ5111147.1 hypothetical protein N7532_001682 [Penicillium argentinense]